jgi:EpsI family protein
MDQRRRALVASILLGSTAVLSAVGKPRDKLADMLPPLDLEAAFPRSFGSWQIDDRMPVVLPSPDTQAKLDLIYNKVISRTYVDAKGQRMMLSVAYGGDQSDGMRTHLPEVCYPAQGFQVLSRKTGLVTAAQRELPVVRLVTRLSGRHEPVTYWITVGDAVVPSRTDQKLVQIEYGLRGVIPDGMLVRVSSIDTDAANAFVRQAEFIADLAVAMPAAARPRILGAR